MSMNFPAVSGLNLDLPPGLLKNPTTSSTIDTQRRTPMNNRFVKNHHLVSYLIHVSLDRTVIDPVLWGESFYSECPTIINVYVDSLVFPLLQCQSLYQGQSLCLVLSVKKVMQDGNN